VQLSPCGLPRFLAKTLSPSLKIVWLYQPSLCTLRRPFQIQSLERKSWFYPSGALRTEIFQQLHELVGWRSLGTTPGARFLENWMIFDEINNSIECLRTTAVLL
jgi:hypothetical protein